MQHQYNILNNITRSKRPSKTPSCRPLIRQPRPAHRRDELHHLVKNHQDRLLRKMGILRAICCVGFCSFSFPPTPTHVPFVSRGYQFSVPRRRQQYTQGQRSNNPTKAIINASGFQGATIVCPLHPEGAKHARHRPKCSFLLRELIPYDQPRSI
jgi:hypothetical protein